MDLIIYNATDLAAAKKTLIAYLGVEPYADSPYYVGFRRGMPRLPRSARSPT